MRSFVTLVSGLRSSPDPVSAQGGSIPVLSPVSTGLSEVILRLTSPSGPRSGRETSKNPCTSTWEVQENGGAEEHSPCARRAGGAPKPAAEVRSAARRRAGRRTGAHRHHGIPVEKRDRVRSQERSQERLCKICCFCDQDFRFHKNNLEGLSGLMYSIPASAESTPVLPQVGDSRLAFRTPCGA
jgi:hypothetical protein